MPTSEIIMGIDPGSLIMGYALIKKRGQQQQVILMDVLNISKEKDIYIRLQKIHSKVLELIKLYNPSALAIEAPFFGKNIQSMLKLGRAQGVAIAAAMQGNLKVFEYSPKKIKQSITGNGNASKEQVWKMLATILKIENKPTYLDASDALSVALCHIYQSNNLISDSTNKSKDWKTYLQKNPNKIKSN